MARTTSHPSQSGPVWKSWKYNNMSKCHLRVSKSYNNVDSITLENQGGRITWKQNTQTGPKGRPSTTKDNFLRDSDPRAHSSEAALKHPGKTSKERKIHNSFSKQLWVAGADAAVPGLQLYPFVWTPTYFSSLWSLSQPKKPFFFLFFSSQERKGEMSFICVLVLLYRQRCSQIQGVPWELLWLCRTARRFYRGFRHRTGRLFKGRLLLHSGGWQTRIQQLFFLFWFVFFCQVHCLE